MNVNPAPILELRKLEKQFQLPQERLFAPKRIVQAVKKVDLDIKIGETLALIGESGSGKTTLGRCAARIYPVSNGKILFQGRDITNSRGLHLKKFRRSVQLVFQDPYGSLTPRIPVGKSITEPMRIQFPSDPELQHQKAQEALQLVSLSPKTMDRYPHEFSGGQRQRIAIARALVLEPDLIIADEPVSSLDVSIQSQILNLFMQLKERSNLALLFITHDMAVVNFIADRVAVMYLGQIVEIADCDMLMQNPLHPYSRKLKSSVPRIGLGKRRSSTSESRFSTNESVQPTGCPFHTRCPEARSICRNVNPVLKPVDTNYNHKVACHFR